MKFVWIPPGPFLMGSPREEKDRDVIETQHKVTLTKGFYMGVFTVTQEQWQTVMGNNPSRVKGVKTYLSKTSRGRIVRTSSRKFMRKTRGRIVCQLRLNGVCLSGRNNDTILLWRVDFDKPSKLRIRPARSIRQVDARENHAGRQFPSQCLWTIRHARQCRAVILQDSCGNADYPQQMWLPAGTSPMAFSCDAWRRLHSSSKILSFGRKRSWLEPSNRGIRCGFRLCCFME